MASREGERGGQTDGHHFIQRGSYCGLPAYQCDRCGVWTIAPTWFKQAGYLSVCFGGITDEQRRETCEGRRMRGAHV